MNTTISDSKDIGSMIENLAKLIIQKHSDDKALALVGMRTRGEFIARRIQEQIIRLNSMTPPLGILDVSFYRDDTRAKLKQPLVKNTLIPFDLTDRKLILIDDVLFTGRSVRAAMDAIMDYGRPATIELAVLIDRGHRELPIQPDYVGRVISLASNEAIKVHLHECDAIDEVIKLANA